MPKCRGGWFLLGMVLLVGLWGCQVPAQTASWPSPASEPTQVAMPTPPVAPSLSPIAAPPIVPSVNGDRLFQRVVDLSFERSTPEQRDQARTYLAQVLAQAGWQPEAQSFSGGVNLVAQRPGTDPTAGTLLLVAHYDTVPLSPGADDNASAVAAVLEVAELLGPIPTVRSLAIALFDQEEVGLQGSLAFTQDADNRANLVGVVNLEMLGYACDEPGCQTYPSGLPLQPSSDRGNFIGVVGDREHLPLLQAFQVSPDPADRLPAVLTVPIPFKGLLTPDVLRSDHAPFWAHNIGAVMVGDTANFRNPHYHQPSDRPETLDRRFLAGATQRIVNTLLSLLESRASLATPAQT